MSEPGMRSELVLTKLFGEARANGGVDYIYTLVRVSGLSYNTPDPLVELLSALQASDDGLSDEDVFARYCSLSRSHEPFLLVANLLRCAQKKPYDSFPFNHLYAGSAPEQKEPTPCQMAREVAKMAKDAKLSEIGDLIDEAYPDEIISGCSRPGYRPHTDRLRVAFKNSRSFLTSLLKIYFAERLEYRGKPIFYKLPRFEVLELLVNDEYGLYGFRMHFSNGSAALFARNPDSTECCNVMLEVPVGFWVGNRDELRDEWRVGEKRLYEAGLPGRYNKLGEWKPIIYPGDSRPLQQEALSLSEDDDVRGVLFYMMCTGHSVIEFVVRTSIELPLQRVTFGEKFHLWKCPPLDERGPAVQNVWLYDGWFDVERTDPQYIRSAIATISVAVNRLAFAYNALVDWRLKYTIVDHSPGYATPSEEDLKILDSLLRGFQTAEDAIFLDYAIDWFNRGGSSRNVFMAFLCYYIALESVAVPLADGHIDLGLGYSPTTKSDRKEERRRCIQLKHESLYSEDPARFIQEAYFDCIVGLKQKVRRVAELVFGQDHRYLSSLFKKRKGYSLSDIRSQIAHGELTLLDWNDESLVRKRVGEMAHICKEFLTRLAFALKPSDPLPSWSRLHGFGMSMADPRSTMVISHGRALPTTDWRIRPEWCD